MKQVKSTWRNRIVGYSEEEPDQLLANPSNWRIHPAAQQNALSGVLKEVGLVQNVVANRTTGHLVDGHLRVMLAMRENQPTVPVTWVELSEEEEHLILASLDPLAAMATADAGALDALLSSVQSGEAAVQQMLAELAEDAGLYQPQDDPQDAEPQVDRAEELREQWGVESGQLWRLPSRTPGQEHRLICGDCRESEVWSSLLLDEKVSCIFTSPPYAEQRKAQYGGVPADKYVDWWDAVQANARNVLTNDGSFFVNIKPHCEDNERVLYVFDLVLSMQRRWGWRFTDELCWKHEGIPGQWDNRLKNCFEPVYQFSVGTTKIRHSAIKHRSDRAGRYMAMDGTTSQGNVGFKGAVSSGLALPGNVIEINHGVGRDDSAVHPAKFPVALPEFFIKAYSDEGGIWFDPFGGSGTTMVACENLGRACRMVEISPGYVAVALQRYATAFGIEPELIT